MKEESRADKLLTGAEILVRSLQDLGVTSIFGYTGAAILPVMDELGKSSIRIIVNANEQCAAFSAAGYSRSSGQVGIAIVTSGPAITNTLTAVADAYADSIPLVVIAGQVPEHKLGTDSFQHIDVASVFGPTAKKVFSVHAIDNIEAVIKNAYYIAKSGKPGPVVIDMPVNLQIKSAPYESLDLAYFSGIYEHDSHLSDAQCQCFFELLQQSAHPLLYLGGGLNSEKGSRAIRRFNKLFRIPSVNTLMAKGVVDENGATDLGMLGMFGTPYANMLIQENDFFFALGVRWDDRVAEKVGFAIHATIAFVDIHPEKVHQIRNERRPKFSYIGDVATVLDNLSDYAQKHGITLSIDSWREHAAQVKLSWPLDYNRNGMAIQQAEVLDQLNQLLPPDSIVTTGVGNHQLLAAQYIRAHRPKSFLTSGSFGTMGTGMPVAVGAHIANPEAAVFVIDGDGSFRMNLGELHTIGTNQLAVKILLLNNHSDGMVYNLENSAYGGRHSATLRSGDVDFSLMAQLCGFVYTRRIVRREELAAALADFVHSPGPALLEVITDKEEILYPIVRPGASYADMELGPYIRKVEI